MNKKGALWRLYAMRNLRSRLLLVLIWPVRLSIAARERKEALGSPNRFHAIWMDYRKPREVESQYFGTWAEAVSWARQKAAERGSPAGIVDHAKLAPNPFDMGRLGPVQFEVDAEGNVKRAENPFSN